MVNNFTKLAAIILVVAIAGTMTSTIMLNSVATAQQQKQQKGHAFFRGNDIVIVFPGGKEGPPGPPGEKGEQGEKGDTGASGANGTTTVIYSCPSNLVVKDPNTDHGP